jgi:hypothetical protein
MREMLLERWKVTLKHGDFSAQFSRYIETGTHQDIQSLIELLNNMQQRFGGVEGLGAIRPELARSIRKTGGKARLRMSGGLAAPANAQTYDSNGHMEV